MRGIIAGVLFSALIAAPAPAQMPPPTPPADPPAHCTAGEFGQLDFWLGEWDVYNTAIENELRGQSKVEKVFNGCAIRESWHPFTLLTGGSFNAYDRNAGVWRQTWIDSLGGRADLSGGFEGGKLVLTGEASGLRGTWLSRVTLIPKEDTVRQIADASSDGGKTWHPTFDFTYKRRKPRN